MSLAASTRSESTKLFSTSAWWIIAIVLVLYMGGMAAGMAFLFGGLENGTIPSSAGAPLPSENLAVAMYSIGPTMGYVFPLLIGTLLVTGEFRHKTLTPTFLATPRRGTVLAGKVVVAVLIGAIYAALLLVSTVGPAAGILAVYGLDTQLGESETWLMLGRAALAMVLWTVIGLGLGTLVRNQVAAIVIVLGFTQLVEPILRLAGGFLDGIGTVTQYLPGAASDALVGRSFYTSFGMSGTGDQLEWWVGGLVLVAYGVVLLILGNLTSWRRDLT